MKRIKAFILTALILPFFASPAFADRLPKTTTAEKILTHYFHKYGKKYKGSDFNTYKINNVQIIDVSEIHKNLAAATGNVILRDGPIYRVRCVLEKKSLRWRLVSWEKI